MQDPGFYIQHHKKNKKGGGGEANEKEILFSNLTMSTPLLFSLSSYISSIDDFIITK
jgi:hypothetical protein